MRSESEKILYKKRGWMDGGGTKKGEKRGKERGKKRRRKRRKGIAKN